MKGAIMESLFINEKSIDYAIRKLEIYAPLGHALSSEDWNNLKLNNVFFNIIYSPGVSSPIEKNIPSGSKLISLDVNTLILFPIRQRVAITLHEIGHSLSPNLTGRDGEFIADDYAIDRGFREDLVSSLNYGIVNFPLEFDKPITHERIQRAQNIQA
jgi:hypothetical protein